MTHKILKSVLIISVTFIALTAIGGGIAMIAGIDKFPLEWLADSLFSNYTIPALLLAIIVGGSSLLATIMLIINQKTGFFISIFAGLIMMIFILAEVLILKQTPPGPTVIEIFYFLMGLIVFLLSLYGNKKFIKIIK